MAYRIQRDEPLSAAARRIATEQLRKGLDELAGPGADREAAIHGLRKRIKKMRGLLRLVRSGLGERYERENTWFRDLGRSLAGARDEQSVREALARLCDAEGRGLSAEAIEAARAVLGADGADPHASRPGSIEPPPDLESSLAEAIERVGSWTVEGEDGRVITDGFDRVYRQGRRRWKRAAEAPSAESLHEWRKRVKDHWYHLRLCQDVWPKMMKARRREAKRLADLLGDDHDLSMLRERLAAGAGDGEGGGETSAPELAACCALIDGRRARVQAEALRLGERLYGEKPNAMSKRFAGHWVAWAGSDGPGDA